MKEFHITIMSIDPSDNEEDNHQKYGLRVMATDEKDAIKKGEIEFERQHPSLPIFWVKVISYQSNLIGCYNLAYRFIFILQFR
jgi:hypothetical protein